VGLDTFLLCNIYTSEYTLFYIFLNLITVTFMNHSLHDFCLSTSVFKIAFCTGLNLYKLSYLSLLLIIQINIKTEYNVQVPYRPSVSVSLFFYYVSVLWII